MKVVMYGNFQVSYTSESHHAASLESLGHQVIRLQETEISTDKVLRETANADLFVWVHTHGVVNRGTFTMVRVLDELRRRGIPSVTYHLDLFVGITDRWKTYQQDSYITKLDHFFSVDPKLVDWLNANRRIPTTGHYLPAGVYDQECYLAEPGACRYNVIFVGSERYHASWPYRGKLINWLRKTYGPQFALFGQDAGKVVRGDELNKLYASAKVVVGDTFSPGFHYPFYWSDRIYETTGRGGFIIHPRIAGLEEQFVDGEEIVLYEFDQALDLKEKIDHYIAHDEERERIRKAGHERTKNNHTYRHRWEHVLKEIGK